MATETYTPDIRALIGEEADHPNVPPFINKMARGETGDPELMGDMIRVVSEAQSKLEGQQKSGESDAHINGETSPGKESATVLYQLAIDLLSKNPRLSKRALHNHLVTHHAEAIQAFAQDFGVANGDWAQNEAFNSVYESAVKIVRQSAEEQPKVEKPSGAPLPPEMGGLMAEASLDASEASDEERFAESEEVDAEASPRPQSLDALRSPSDITTVEIETDESTDAADAEALLADLLAYNETEDKKKQNPFQAINKLFGWFTEQYNKGRLRREYLKTLKEHLQAGGSLRVVIVDENKRPIKKPILVTPFSPFAEAYGLATGNEDGGVTEALSGRRDYKKLDNEKDSRAYAFADLDVVVLPMPENRFAKHMRKDPVGILIENIGAELGTLEDSQLEQVRIGAAELQRAVVEVAERIENEMDAIESAIRVVEAQDISEEVAQQMQAKEVKARERLRESMAKGRIAEIKKHMESVLESVHQSTVILERYGDWNVEDLAEGSPLRQALENIQTAIDAIVGWLDNTAIFLSSGNKEYGKVEKNTAGEEAIKIFSLAEFQAQMRQPLVEFYRLIREATVAEYKELYMQSTSNERAQAYAEAVQMDQLGLNDLLDLADEHVPGFGKDVVAYIAQLEGQGVSEADQAEQMYDYVYARLFGRYEDLIQSGVNRVLFGIEADQAKRNVVFDKYTNVVEQSAHYQYAQEAVVDALAPVFHRVLFIAQQQRELLSFLDQVGLLPDNWVQISADGAADYLEAWFSANLTNEQGFDEQAIRGALQNLIAIVQQSPGVNGQYERWRASTDVAERGSLGFGMMLNQQLLGARSSMVEAMAVIAPTGELDDLLFAVREFRTAIDALQEELPANESYIEMNDMLSETEDIYGILHAIADVRDGQMDGAISGRYMEETARILNQKVDELYWPISDRIQQDLATTVA